MKTVHDLLDGCVEIPIVNVKDINVAGPQSLQADLDCEFERLEIVTQIVDVIDLVVSAERRVGILRNESSSERRPASVRGASRTLVARTI